MWEECVFLQAHYKEFDNSVLTMMEHSPSCWRHDVFVQNILKVTNHDLYYKAMIFYLEEEPMLLNDLLKLLSMKIDLPKAVKVMQKAGHLSLITPFLKSVQMQNVSAVNEALNEIFVENEDHESLKGSVEEYDNFESLSLAQRLESHELLDFRRIAAIIYRKNEKWDKSIEISKKDELWKDAIETVSESNHIELAELLLRYFMETGERELFASMLYTCYSLIKPDVAMEIAWRFGLQEYVMPYFVQFMKDLSGQVSAVKKETDNIKEEAAKDKENLENQPIGGFDASILFPSMGVPQIQAIMPSPGQMGGMGAPAPGAFGQPQFPGAGGPGGFGQGF